MSVLEVFSALEDTINAWGDDNIKDGGTGKYGFCVAFTMSFCAI